LADNGRTKWQHKATSGQIMTKRILVALDSSTHSAAALEAAARLAAKLSAELIGLFVEDINLMRLAELPLFGAVDATSAIVRPLNSQSMAADLRLQAAQARRALARAAERVHVKYSFKVARGQVTPELLAAALEVDLLTLGRGSRGLGRRRLGSTARAIAAQCSRSTLLMTTAIRPEQPVMVTFDGSESAVAAARAAVELAEALGAGLKALLLAATPSRAQELREQINEMVNGRDLTVTFQFTPHLDAASLAQLTRSAEGCILVLGDPLAHDADNLQLLLDQLDCPVLIVR
jgi:nucleotide-binding universal stress UspA family protein